MKLAVNVLIFPPKLSRDVVLAMTSTISKWLNLSARGEERVMFCVFLNIHANVTRFIIVSIENLYEDYHLPHIKFRSKILNEFLRDEMDLYKVLVINVYNSRLNNK